MLKRRVFLLFAFIAIAGFINAQVRPGIKIGYNFGGVMGNYRGDKSPEELKYTAGDPGNFHMKSGFQVGLVADWPINDVLAIQPGARLSMQGFTDKYISNGEAVRKFSLFYLQVPVYAQYRLNVAEDVNVLFQAGPYAGVGLFGRQSFTRKGKSQTLSDSQKKISFGNGVSDDIPTIDFGIGAGAGIEFFRFQFMVAYDFGLNNPLFYKKDAKSATYNVDVRNHVLSATLTVIFGRRDPLQNAKD